MRSGAGYSSETPAEYPSGLRGRIANPLFVGSNPTSAFLPFPIHSVTTRDRRASDGGGVMPPQARAGRECGLDCPSRDFAAGGMVESVPARVAVRARRSLLSF